MKKQNIILLKSNLKINAYNGELVKGTKLNNKGEDYTYEFGNFLADSKSCSLRLVIMITLV